MHYLKLMGIVAAAAAALTALAWAVLGAEAPATLAIHLTATWKLVLPTTLIRWVSLIVCPLWAALVVALYSADDSPFIYEGDANLMLLLTAAVAFLFSFSGPSLTVGIVAGAVWSLIAVSISCDDELSMLLWRIGGHGVAAGFGAAIGLVTFESSALVSLLGPLPPTAFDAGWLFGTVSAASLACAAGLAAATAFASAIVVLGGILLVLSLVPWPGAKRRHGETC